MAIQPSTSKEVNGFLTTLNANQSSSSSYSGTETTTCDSDRPIFQCEKKTKELLPNYNKEVDDKLATTNVHQPSSSNNLDFTLLCNVNQHVKAKN